MATITLKFLPPTDPNIKTLHVSEATAMSGPFSEIDSTDAVGSYPTYIDQFTTSLAASETNWFSISWENTAGDVSDLSAPIQGGTSSLISEIVDRVLLSDASMDENIVYQEAEVVISQTMGTQSPQALQSSDATIKQISGMTYLTLARTLVRDVSGSSNVESYTAGIVALKTGTATTSNKDQIDALLKMAARDLGVTVNGIVMQLKEIPVGGNYKRLPMTVDLSRAIVEI